MAKAIYEVEFYLAGGQTITLQGYDLQVGVVPDKDEEGNPLPRAGELTGFNLETIEREKLAYLYMRVPQVDAIKATTIRSATGSDKKDAEREE